MTQDNAQDFYDDNFISDPQWDDDSLEDDDNPPTEDTDDGDTNDYHVSSDDSDDLDNDSDDSDDSDDEFRDDEDDISYDDDDEIENFFQLDRSLYSPTDFANEVLHGMEQRHCFRS